MSELTCRIAVYANTLYTHTLEKAWHNDAAYRVHSVKGNLETCCTYSLYVNSRKLENRIKMCVCKILLLDDTKVVNLCEIEVFCLCASKNGSTFSRIEELTLLVEKLEGVPLLRVVRSCEDDTSVCLFEYNRHFCSRSRAKASLHYIHSASDEGTADELLYHIAGKTCVLSYNNLIALSRRLWSALAHLLAVCIAELYDIKWRKSLARCTADCTADT